MNESNLEPRTWEKGAERRLLSTRVFDVWGVHFRNPGRGTDREFIVMKSPDWVNVVAVTGDGKIVLVRQFRVGTGAVSLEIPGGVMEEGEDPVAAGLRELKEETGYGGGTARVLASVNPNPAIQSNRTHFVLVEGAELQGGTDWDADEELETMTAPVDDVLRWAHEGKVTHALVVCALFHYEAVWRARGRK